MPNASPEVIIVGAGFAGIKAAKALARAPVEVTVIDRRNYHLFQPLLYQVATASLSPADISAPIRSILRDQANCRVVLAEAQSIDLAKRIVVLAEGTTLPYDYLIVAAGAAHAYSNHPEWARLAPGLKRIEDAIELRRRILLAFELAEYEPDEEHRKAALTFAIVGAGPTGVELAKAIKEIAARTIPRDFRHIDTRTTRVILIEGGDRVLPTFAPALSHRAQADLEHMGVEVCLKAMVTEISAQGVRAGDQFVAAHNVFWAAGVEASPLARSLQVPLDRAGRVIVNPDLTIPSHPDVFAIGDLAAVTSADTGKSVPGMAPGAMQEGAYVGRIIAAETAGKSLPGQRQPFRYRDKGMLATIGKARAVAQIGSWRFGGLFAWLLWGVVHIAFLVNFRNRPRVLLNWFWGWLINARDARLITGEVNLTPKRPRDVP